MGTVSFAQRRQEQSRKGFQEKRIPFHKFPFLKFAVEKTMSMKFALIKIDVNARLQTLASWPFATLRETNELDWSYFLHFAVRLGLLHF